MQPDLQASLLFLSTSDAIVWHSPLLSLLSSGESRVPVRSDAIRDLMRIRVGTAAHAVHTTYHAGVPSELSACEWVYGQAWGGRLAMNNLVYLVGLIVVILAILSLFGLR